MSGNIEEETQEQVEVSQFVQIVEETTLEMAQKGIVYFWCQNWTSNQLNALNIRRKLKHIPHDHSTELKFLGSVEERN